MLLFNISNCSPPLFLYVSLEEWLSAGISLQGHGLNNLISGQ